MARQRYVKVVIKIEDGGSISVDNLNIYFDAFKTDKPENNTANVTIHGLTRQKNDAIVSAKKAVLELYAGYQDETIGLVFKGDISFATHSYDEINRSIIIQVKDGAEITKTSTIKIEKEYEVYDQQILKEAFAQADLDPKTIPAFPNKLIWQSRPNFSYSGGIGGLLDEICKNYKMTWSFHDNGSVVFSSSNQESNLSVVMNENNGMVGSPKRYKATKQPNTQGNQEQISQQSEQIYGYNTTCQLNARIKPNVFMKLSSRLFPIDNLQRIVSVSYIGSNTADSEFVCRIESVDV